MPEPFKSIIHERSDGTFWCGEEEVSKRSDLWFIGNTDIFLIGDVEVVTIQTEPEWLYPGNSAANDAALLSCREWNEVWGCPRWTRGCIYEWRDCDECQEAHESFGDSIPYK